MFQNREEAGKLLANRLRTYKKSPETIIFAIPRGGVVIGRLVASILSLPLKIIVIKKLTAPNNPELAIGAIAPSGVKYIDWDLVSRNGVEQKYLDKEIVEKRNEVDERIRKFRAQDLELEIKKKKQIILIDDGVATGSTTLVAIKYLKQLSVISYQSLIINRKSKNNHQPSTINHQPTIILAVPVVAKDSFVKLKSEVDKIVALAIPETFQAVGQFYREFPQVSDDEVISLLEDSY